MGEGKEKNTASSSAAPVALEVFTLNISNGVTAAI